MNTTATRLPLSLRVYTVDLAKHVFQVHTFDAHGQCLRRERLLRSKFAAKFEDARTVRGVVVMEACGSSNYWARRFAKQGYRIHLVPPQFVAKRRIGNKNDGNDADTIYAVYTDPRVRPVPVKTLAQQDLAALHRVRARLVRQQTQCTNQIRGLLAERGLVAKKGKAGLAALLSRLNQTDEPQVTDALRYLIATVVEQLDEITKHVKNTERQLKRAYRQSPTSRRLGSVFGVGLMIATACTAEYGDSVDRFSDCRQFAASVGATPSEHSSGETQRHGAITKRGNTYLRWLLVQGAQNVVNHCRRRDDALCLLARRMLDAHKPRNTVIVAVANHMARLIYAVIKHGVPYSPTGRRGRPDATVTVAQAA